MSLHDNCGKICRVKKHRSVWNTQHAMSVRVYLHVYDWIQVIWYMYVFVCMCVCVCVCVCVYIRVNTPHRHTSYTCKHQSMYVCSYVLPSPPTHTPWQNFCVLWLTRSLAHHRDTTNYGLVSHAQCLHLEKFIVATSAQKPVVTWLATSAVPHLHTIKIKVCPSIPFVTIVTPDTLYINILITKEWWTMYLEWPLYFMA